MEQEAQRRRDKNITNSCKNIYSKGKQLDLTFSIFVEEVTRSRVGLPSVSSLVGRFGIVI